LIEVKTIAIKTPKYFLLLLYNINMCLCAQSNLFNVWIRISLE